MKGRFVTTVVLKSGSTSVANFVYEADALPFEPQMGQEFFVTDKREDEVTYNARVVETEISYVVLGDPYDQVIQNRNVIAQITE